MIRRFYTLLLLLLITSYVYADKTMSEISENTRQTALHTAKGEFEYTSFAISLFALLIAGITLYYSVRTYKSQKRTEINTQRWNTKQERIVLRRLGQNVFNNIVVFHYLDKTMKQSRLLVAKRSAFDNMKIDIEDLHTNDYFGEGVNYDLLLDLKRSFCDYNAQLERLGQLADSHTLRETLRFSSGNYDFFLNYVKISISLFLQIGTVYHEMFSINEKRLYKNYNISYTQEDIESYDFKETLSKFARELSQDEKLMKHLDLDYFFPYKIIYENYSEWDEQKMKEPGIYRYLRPFLYRTKGIDKRIFTETVDCILSRMDFNENDFFEPIIDPNKGILEVFDNSEQKCLYLNIQQDDFARIASGKVSFYSVPITVYNAEALTKKKIEGSVLDLELSKKDLNPIKRAVLSYNDGHYINRISLLVKSLNLTSEKEGDSDLFIEYKSWTVTLHFSSIEKFTR